MKRIVLSGVNRGIGEGVARVFLQAGWEVHGFGRSAPYWTSSFPGTFRFHCRDMADHSGLEAACKEVIGPVDILLCSAATFGGMAFHAHDFDSSAFMETLAVNLVAPAIMARSLKPALLQASQGVIALMSTGNASLAGNREGTMLAYRTSKSALNQLARNLAAEWGSEGITTVALNPGWVRTSMGGETAPTSVEEASIEVYRFLTERIDHSLNGSFVNVDRSLLPW